MGDVAASCSLGHTSHTYNLTFSDACVIITLFLNIDQCLLSFFWDYLRGAFKQLIEL